MEKEVAADKKSMNSTAELPDIYTKKMLNKFWKRRFNNQFANKSTK